jgi:signal transduction histidine kinase
LFASLSARLLVLTIFFVMLAEVMIFAPSAGRYRAMHLQERLADAHLAGLALEATPSGQVSPVLEAQLLRHVGAYAIDLHLGPLVTRMLGKEELPPIDHVFNLDRETPIIMIMRAFEVIRRDEPTTIRITGRSPSDPSVIVSLVMAEAPMRAALIDYSRRILELSIIISLITAGLVYFSLQWLMVRPLGKLTEAMTDFRAVPEDAERGVQPTRRRDEIGVAEREFAEMQRDLRQALAQKARLAALGEAVAKINHDLRNILSTAQLVSDRIEDSDDPEVRRVAPTMLRAIDRAVALCRDVVRYARTGEAKLQKSSCDLRELIEDAGDAAVSAGGGQRQFQNFAPENLNARVDRAQLARAIENLTRNAYEAGAQTVTAAAVTSGAKGVRISLSDDGPGIPAAMEPRLFQPFSGSSKADGSGLGLAIAKEIATAHGGDIALARSGPDGAEFVITLPKFLEQAK